MNIPFGPGHPGWMPEWTDEELGQTIESAESCGDAAGGLAAEAWKRYNDKKKECERLRRNQVTKIAERSGIPDDYSGPY